MADCINDDNEIELDVSTTYYSGKDPVYKKGREGEPIDGLSFTRGELNSAEEIKGVSEIKKCKPLKVAESLLPKSEAMKCEIKAIEEESTFSWLISTLLGLFRGEQKSTGDTVAKSIVLSVTALFFIFMIYKNKLYSIAYLKSLLFTLIFLFKRFWVFFIILFFLSLTYNVIFSYLPYFSDQALKYLYLSINHSFNFFLFCKILYIKFKFKYLNNNIF